MTGTDQPDADRASLRRGVTSFTRCGSSIDDDSLLAGKNVYAEMAGGNDRDAILSTYDGIEYGSKTVLCADCLDTPSDCGNCGGTGVVETGGGSRDEAAGETEPCPVCDGTGHKKPDILRDSCRLWGRALRSCLANPPACLDRPTFQTRTTGRTPPKPAPPSRAILLRFTTANPSNSAHTGLVEPMFNISARHKDIQVNSI